ncbi:hypothetical protein D3C87_1902620 [compost metagenome]
MDANTPSDSLPSRQPSPQYRANASTAASAPNTHKGTGKRRRGVCAGSSRQCGDKASAYSPRAPRRMRSSR